MTLRTPSWFIPCVLALGWMAALVGCLASAGALIALYFLLLRGVTAGQPMIFGTVAPPLSGAWLHLANGLALIGAPFVLRWAIRRLQMSRTGGNGAPGSA